jgi:CubicO group peptidase (beta-lactamase class C family)
MIRTMFAAAALLLACPSSAQSEQERLNERYNRALAAGYKALMLCGAIANAQSNGTTRTPESVAGWELTGIQAPLDELVGGLPYEIVRGPTGTIVHVAVSWADDMPARIAGHNPGRGCHVEPVGASLATAHPAPVTSLAARQAEFLEDDHSVEPVDAAMAGEAYGVGTRTTAALVIRNRMIAVERYAPGFDENTPQRTWSVAKSIAATLVGAAVQRGEGDVAASAGLGESDADPRRAITIDLLLRMASGRYSDTPGNRTDPLYWGGATVEEVALDWPLIAAPGSTYRYANNDTLAAIAAIKPTFAAHRPAELFAALGMGHTVAETDWQGNTILSSQVWTTARDLARFGQLYLNDGKLPDGTRILPEGWARYVSSPSGPQPDGPFGYGAGFWLLNKSDGVPPDTYAAFGNRGQYVVIVPSRQMVIVRRGEDPVGSRFDIAAFTRDVLAALESK